MMLLHNSIASSQLRSLVLLQSALLSLVKYMSKPMMTESDGESATLFLKAARLRNLTYSDPLYVYVSKSVTKRGHDGEEVTETQVLSKVFIGKVPIMLRSSYCILYQNSEKDLTELGLLLIRYYGNCKIIMNTRFFALQHVDEEEDIKRIAAGWIFASLKTQSPPLLLVE